MGKLTLCLFEEVSNVGHLITCHGVKPNPECVCTVINMSQTSKKYCDFGEWSLVLPNSS